MLFQSIPSIYFLQITFSQKGQHFFLFQNNLFQNPPIPHSNNANVNLYPNMNLYPKSSSIEI